MPYGAAGRGRGFLADFLRASECSKLLLFSQEASEYFLPYELLLKMRAAASSDLLASARKVRKTPRPILLRSLASLSLRARLPLAGQKKANTASEATLRFASQLQSF